MSPGLRPRLLYAVTDPLSFRLGSGQVLLMKCSGYEVHAVSSPGPLAVQFSRSDGVPVYSVPMARRISPLRDLRALIMWLLVVRRIRPSVIHAGTPKAAVLGTFAAWILRVPVRIYYVHGLPLTTARGLKKMLLSVIEKTTCAAATHVVCVGPSMRRELIERGLCDERKAVVLAKGSSNGIDLEVFDPARHDAATRAAVRRRLGIPADALVIGFIARLGREKGIEQLLDAWRTVREECKGAHLLVIGPAEPNDPPSAECLDALQRDPRVCMPGAIWDTAPLYAAMDVFCLPSHREGVPNVLLEAAAMRVPVVAFGVPGVVDAVSNGVTGTLVEPLNVNALAAALRKYLQNPSMRGQHGAAGRDWVSAHFDREKVWLALTKFYSSVNFAGRPSHPPAPRAQSAVASR